MEALEPGSTWRTPGGKPVSWARVREIVHGHFGERLFDGGIDQWRAQTGRAVVPGAVEDELIGQCRIHGRDVGEGS